MQVTAASASKFTPCMRWEPQLHQLSRKHEAVLTWASQWACLAMILSEVALASRNEPSGSCTRRSVLTASLMVWGAFSDTRATSSLITMMRSACSGGSA